jgi:hypothetical protein
MASDCTPDDKRESYEDYVDEGDELSPSDRFHMRITLFDQLKRSGDIVPFDRTRRLNRDDQWRLNKFVFEKVGPDIDLNALDISDMLLEAFPEAPQSSNFRTRGHELISILSS